MEEKVLEYSQIIENNGYNILEEPLFLHLYLMSIWITFLNTEKLIISRFNDCNMLPNYSLLKVCNRRLPLCHGLFLEQNKQLYISTYFTA